MQINTPKDLDNVKTRMAFGLTKRQIICFAVGGCIGFPLYLVLRKVLPTDAAALLMMAVIFPVFFFALYEKDGKSAEQVLFDIYNHRIRSKGIRRYRTENYFDRLEEKEKIRKEITELENKKNRKGNGKKQDKGKAGREKQRE